MYALLLIHSDIIVLDLSQLTKAGGLSAKERL